MGMKTVARKGREKNGRNGHEKRAPSQRWRRRARSDRGVESDRGREGRRTIEGLKDGNRRGNGAGPRPPRAVHSRSAGWRGVRLGGAVGSGMSGSGSSCCPCRQLALRSLAVAPATRPTRHVRGTCSGRKCTCSPPWGGEASPRVWLALRLGLDWASLPVRPLAGHCWVSHRGIPRQPNGGGRGN